MLLKENSLHVKSYSGVRSTSQGYLQVILAKLGQLLAPRAPSPLRA